MDILIFEPQIVFYFQLFLSANGRHNPFTRQTRHDTLVALLKSELCYMNPCEDLHEIITKAMNYSEKQ